MALYSMLQIEGHDPQCQASQIVLSAMTFSRQFLAFPQYLHVWRHSQQIKSIHLLSGSNKLKSPASTSYVQFQAQHLAHS
jgi:hypothetical protein